jgi:hypothetical protein
VHIPEDIDSSDNESPEVISFEKEAIGYIEDELAQGYGLEQVKKELLEEGYPEEIINSAAQYVQSHSKVSKKDKEKVLSRDEDKHVERRFHIPLIGIFAVIIIAMAIFFIFGTGQEEKQEMPEKIDIFLYENLGISPGQDKLAGSEQIYSRDEIVDKIRAESSLRDNSGNPTLSQLKLSYAVSGFEKKATLYSIVGKGGLSQKTLVEIRFQPTKDMKVLKIVEVIPKSTATSDLIELTQGGVIAEQDPILVFTFINAKPDSVLKAVYVINKKISQLDTITFPAEEMPKPQTAAQDAVCGDARCVEGESYLSCCQDCGCPQGFTCTNNACTAEQKDKCQSDAECDDSLAETKDKCAGTPKDCQHAAITECLSGDEYCPSICTYDIDTDCTAPEVNVSPAIEIMEEPNITGPQEPPDILNVTIIPDTLKMGDELIIYAKVIDPNGKEDIERVWLEIMELAQSHGEIADMLDNGNAPDAQANDNIYTVGGVISEYYMTGAYHVNVFAQDKAGNKKKMQKTFRVVDGNQTG